MSISKKMIGAAAFAACLLSAGSVLAVEAAAKSAVNVRTGPGTSYGIVGQLAPGEIVNVTECAPSNFCFVERNGADGWVSANYLTAVEDEEEEEMEEGGGSNPDCSFGFVVGPGGPSLSISCGDAPLPPAPPAPPAAAEACLYTGNNFNGDDLCVGVGVRNALNATFNNKISSIELTGGAKAMLCDGPNLTGVCKNITTDTAPLQPSINDKTSSFSIYVGAPPVVPPPVIELPPVIILPGPPETFSTGPIDLQQTFSANLDNGAVGGAGVDIWYQAVTAVEKYITPRNGATIAVGDGSNRGYEGCTAESFSGDDVPLADIPVGTYVCVKTNQGRISQFRVNGFMGTTMKLGYTTWAN
jgi:uncharacterized protein YraI